MKSKMMCQSVYTAMSVKHCEFLKNMALIWGTLKAEGIILSLLLCGKSTESARLGLTGGLYSKASPENVKGGRRTFREKGMECS